MAITQTGLWQSVADYLNGTHIPDLGITEALGIHSVDNPAVLNGGALFYQPQPQGQNSGVNSQGGVGNQPYGPPAPTPRPQNINRNIVTGTPPANVTNPVNQNTGNPGLPPVISEEELNSIYNPAAQYLTQQEALAGQYQTESLASGQEQYNLQNKVNQESYNRSGETIGNQETQNSQIEQNAINQARRAYNEISQGIQSRYGTSSSAGGAFSELLGRSTNESLGNIFQNYTNQVAQTQQARRQIDADLAIRNEQATKDYNDLIREVKLKFQENVANINGQRGQLESAKAAARIDALREARNQAYNIQVARDAYQQQLQLYSLANKQAYDQQEGQLNTYLQNYLKNAGLGNAEIQSQVSSITNPLTGVAAVPKSSTDYLSTIQGIYNPNKSLTEEQKKLNPFLA